MPSLRVPKRKKSRKERAAQAARKAAKGNAIVQVAKRAPNTRLPLIAGGAALLALVAAKLIRGRGGHPATA